MKKLFVIFTVFCALAACKHETEPFKLNGMLDDLKSDSLLLIYEMPQRKLDTIAVDNGHFSCEIEADTVTIFRVMLDSLKAIPVFATNGEQVKINGRTDSIEITGTGDNALMNEIIHLLPDTVSPKVLDMVDSLISLNPTSYTNLFLMERYYVNVPAPNKNRIAKVLRKIDGRVRDLPYMLQIAEIANTPQIPNNTYITNSLYFGAQGNTGVKATDVANRYILLNFWASWDKASIAAEDSIAKIVKALRHKPFIATSISLDVDQQAWRMVSERDTTQWRQVCDGKSWDNALVKELGITHLPANALVNKERRIVARNLAPSAIIDSIKSWVKRDAERKKKVKKPLRNHQAK